MKRNIINKLKQIESAYGIKVIYACLSGSRIYEEHKDNSDYDIKFIFVHPRLTIDKPIENIHLMEGELDLTGYSLSVFLNHVRENRLQSLEMVSVKDEHIFINLNNILTGIIDIWKEYFCLELFIYRINSITLNLERQIETSDNIKNSKLKKLRKRYLVVGGLLIENGINFLNISFKENKYRELKCVNYDTVKDSFTVLLENLKVTPKAFYDNQLINIWYHKTIVSFLEESK